MKKSSLIVLCRSSTKKRGRKQLQSYGGFQDLGFVVLNDGLSPYYFWGPSGNILVGHTDNVGSIETNRSLSRQRATAVAAALVNTCQVAPGRILARGVSNLCPVASNQSEEGRAKNRRVELVRQ